MRQLEVLEPGTSALIEDLGRPGHAHLGVAPSGALDAPALRLANRLVGNPESDAGIETVLGGLVLRAHSSCTVAVTGPPVPAWVDGRAVGSHLPVHLAAGRTLRLGMPSAGLRCYLAFSGGIAAPTALGSRSTDALSGIGPAPLRAGDLLPLGEPRGLPAGADEVIARVPDGELTVPVLLGPRDEWFDDPARALAGTWTVSTDSNRVGLRLDGPRLQRAEPYADTELPSEAILTGAIQVPPDGAPVVFLADHPTTGGYPVIATVHPDALPLLAQARPGTWLRFRPV